MKKVTGAALAAEALLKQDIEKIFTLSGGHITPLYQYLENSRIELFDTRHEQAAVFMAEAWARMTRRAATAMVTAGPGFTNALTGIASARLSNSPLVLIAGCVGLETREKGDLQDMPQAPVIAPMVKKALVCHVPERIPEFVDMAYRIAENGRPGPVYLELPVDVLNAEADPAKAVKPQTRVTSRPVDREAAGIFLRMISAAKKPMVIAGSGSWYSHSEENLKKFIEQTGMPLYTFAMGRGILPDTHPLCFESALAIRPGSAMHASLNSDLVIILGSRMNLFNIYGGVYNPAAKIVQVDIHADEIGQNRSVDLPVCSDISAFLEEILQRLENEKAFDGGKFTPWVEELTGVDKQGKELASLNWKSDAEPIHPLRLAAEINEFMNRDDDIVIADGGDTTTWIGMTRTMKQGGHYLDYGLYGSLAVGLPYANAAKLLYPDKRVLLMAGDGSIGFNFMEYETSLRKGLPVVTVISNDLGWGMIRHSQEIRMGHAIENGTWIGKVNYHKMVEAMGGLGLYVEKPGDIRPALEEAFKSKTTACINVMTDPTTVSPGSIALANLGGYKAE